MNEEFDCYVLMWKYSDGSGCGVVGVYDENEVALDMLEFLGKHGDQSKSFWIELSSMTWRDEVTK